MEDQVKKAFDVLGSARSEMEKELKALRVQINYSKGNVEVERTKCAKEIKDIRERHEKLKASVLSRVAETEAQQDQMDRVNIELQNAKRALVQSRQNYNLDLKHQKTERDTILKDLDHQIVNKNTVLANIVTAIAKTKAQVGVL